MFYTFKFKNWLKIVNIKITVIFNEIINWVFLSCVNLHGLKNLKEKWYCWDYNHTLFCWKNIINWFCNLLCLLLVNDCVTSNNELIQVRSLSPWARCRGFNFDWDQLLLNNGKKKLCTNNKGKKIVIINFF